MTRPSSHGLPTLTEFHLDSVPRPQAAISQAGEAGEGLPAKRTPRSGPEGCPPRLSSSTERPTTVRPQTLQWWCLKAATRGRGRAVVLPGREGDWEGAGMTRQPAKLNRVRASVGSLTRGVCVLNSKDTAAHPAPPRIGNGKGQRRVSRSPPGSNRGEGELSTPTRGNSPHHACGCPAEPSLKTTALAPPLQRKTPGPERRGTVPGHLSHSQKKPAAGCTAGSWPPPAPPFPHLASSSTSQRSPSEGVCWGGRNKVSQARGLQTTELYCLWVLETTSLRSRCHQG